MASVQNQGGFSGGERGVCSSMFRFPRVEGNPAAAWRVAPQLKRSRRALRSRRCVTAPRQPRGVGVVIQPRRGVVSPPQPPPFLAGLISHFIWSSSSVKLLFFFPSVFSWWWFVDVRTQSAASGCTFSEAGSWCRDLAAASASAAGGAAPVPTGPAASWSSTRST